MKQDEGKSTRKDETATSSINTPVIKSLLSGSLSSTFTTILFQPLELLKTRIQLTASKSKSIGRATKTAIRLVRQHNFGYLWRGTGASLVRSVPGVSIYYASLNTLQNNFSDDGNKPNSSGQAFCFGLISRSFVSLCLLPVTSIKVRYESGQHKYSSLADALKRAYLHNGWVGVTPTILRDSLFSGIYYMSYTELKRLDQYDQPGLRRCERNFQNGLISGLVASILTNPLDVLKTNAQIDSVNRKSMRQTAFNMIENNGGYRRFFDGLVLRSLRRTMIAATTWTLYELMTDSS